MSTMRQKNCTCSVCGKEDTYIVLTSTNAFGSPDLDMRPPEMKRSTMNLWVQECAGCGYVASRVEQKTVVDCDYLSSEEYKLCNGIAFASRLAARFYKYYLISLKGNEPVTAFNAVHHAAWSCDDCGDSENAVRCRKIAIDLLDELLAGDSLAEYAGEYVVLKADLLRRAGMFDEVVRQYENYESDDEILNDIILFQLQKAEEKDIACYRVADTRKSE